jgi:uncharacterized membrane protein
VSRNNDFKCESLLRNKKEVSTASTSTIDGLTPKTVMADAINKRRVALIFMLNSFDER